MKNSGNDPKAEFLCRVAVVVLTIYILVCIGAIVVGVLDTVL